MHFFRYEAIKVKAKDRHLGSSCQFVRLAVFLLKVPLNIFHIGQPRGIGIKQHDGAPVAASKIDGTRGYIWFEPAR